MDEKIPLNELLIDSNSFRAQLEPYSIEEMDNYLKKEKYIKGFNSHELDCLLTYLVERMETERGKKYIIEGKEKDNLGAYLTKGMLIVKGHAGQHAGLSMKGGSVSIGGEADYGPGYQAEGGMLLIGGNIVNGAGLFMKGGIIICLGRIGSVHEHMTSGKIYADEFYYVPEKVKKFIFGLEHAFRDKYYRLPKEFKKMFNEKIKNDPKKYFPYANNDEKRKLLSELSGVDERTIEFEYEKGQVW